jgi:hypothetical protein
MKMTLLLSAAIAALSLNSCTSPSPCTNDCGPREIDYTDRRYEIDDHGYYPPPAHSYGYGYTAYSAAPGSTFFYHRRSSSSRSSSHLRLEKDPPDYVRTVAPAATRTLVLSPPMEVTTTTYVRVREKDKKPQRQRREEK